MQSIFTSELLAALHTPTATPTPVAVLCLSQQWGPLEQHTLELAAALHEGGHVVRLVVAPDCALHRAAQARNLACHGVQARWKSINLRAAVALAHWLRRQTIGVLLTTHPADLGLASLAKKWAGPGLRLVHRQLEPLAAVPVWQWWPQQVTALDAWVAPMPAQARQVLARTRLDQRRLWVVPPPLSLTPDLATADPVHPGSRCEARHLLDLPAAAPLIGVMDCGGDGPVFAVEALYRLRAEHGSTAELVVIGGPDTPPNAARWAGVRQLAQQLRLHARLHLRPLHNAAHPALFYQALDVLLLPAPANASGQDLLEAMTSGCPLVSVAEADAQDLLDVSAGAHLFPRHDVAACARQLAQALQGPVAARTAAARMARLVTQQCHPRQQGQQLETILQYLCSHPQTA